MNEFSRIVKIKWVVFLLSLSILFHFFSLRALAESVGEDYPVLRYNEPRLEIAPDSLQWSEVEKGLHFSWASRDIHYKLHEVPDIVPVADTVVRGWKGEKVNLLAVMFSNSDFGDISLRTTPWVRFGELTDINSVQARFVNYVITDDFKSCGNHPMDMEQWLVPDIIDLDMPKRVVAMETRPVWCTVDIPRGIDSGEYVTKVEAVDSVGSVIAALSLRIQVVNRTLPEAEDWKFHLDLWQQPYSISRYYGVERWSDSHLELLRPYLQALSNAGQKSVTAIMFYEPWGEQTHKNDKFDPMIQTIKSCDGSWKYDYTNFDKYVELCHEYQIDKQINCYSMVPWDMNFRYLNELTGEYEYLKTTTSTDEYRALWVSFLRSFKEHLVQKGWFDKTNIAMDERSESDMMNAYAIATALGFKMALAGNYHSSLSPLLQDYCVAIGQDKLFTANELEQRKRNGQITTIYTSCADKEPNIYSNSYPAEAAYLPLYSAAAGLDGYLHWSWINWHENPLIDTRYRLFGSGDTFCYYPGNRSSVRFERLVEGIQQYEKVMILKDEFKDNPVRMDELNRLLECFKDSEIEGEKCGDLVNEIEHFLNKDEEKVIFNTSDGDGVVPPYRIPAIAQNNEGKLIAVAASLVCGTDPGFGQIDIVSRMSDDGGQNWGELSMVAVGTGRTSSQENFFDTAFGDPAIVADRESSRVLIMAVAGCTLFTDSKTNRENPNLIATIRSEDGGTTWGNPVDITEEIYSLFDKDNPMDAVFVSSGKILQSRVVKVGDYYRLYAALCSRPGGNRVIYSDDFGDTWSVLGGAKVISVPGGDEAKCEELADGTLLISSRTSGGRIYNLFSYTNIAKGKGKWGIAQKSDFSDSGKKIGRNATNGSVVVLNAVRVSDNKECQLLLQSLPTADTRSDLGIYFKELPEKLTFKMVKEMVEGWQGYFIVDQSDAAYSSMLLLSDGRIALLYEKYYKWFGRRPNPVSTTFLNGEGDHNFDGYDIVYQVFDLETITAGRYRVL